MIQRMKKAKNKTDGTLTLKRLSNDQAYIRWFLKYVFVINTLRRRKILGPRFGNDKFCSRETSVFFLIKCFTFALSGHQTNKIRVE